MLVPPNGKAETKDGELLRVVSNLYYEYYNNGNCNLTNSDGELTDLAIEYLTVIDNELGTDVEDSLYEIITGYYLNSEAKYSQKNKDMYEDMVNLAIEKILK